MVGPSSASLSGFSMAGYSGASFRPQLPIAPVVYPPYCGRGCTARYFMQSKILAVAAIFMGLAFVIAFACAFLPFWFILKFNILDSTFGTEGIRKIVANAGIFFYDEKEYVSLILLEKSTNRVVIPRKQYSFNILQLKFKNMLRSVFLILY